MYYNSFRDPEDLEEYIADIEAAPKDVLGNFDRETWEKLDKDSKLVTLYTCYDAASLQRYLVQAVLVSVEK